MENSDKETLELASAISRYGEDDFLILAGNAAKQWFWDVDERKLACYLDRISSGSADITIDHRHFEAFVLRVRHKIILRRIADHFDVSSDTIRSWVGTVKMMLKHPRVAAQIRKCGA